MSLNKIFWAFDPYSENKEAWKKAVRVIKEIRADKNCEVQPIYFLNQEPVYSISQTSVYAPPSAETLVPIIEKVMATNMKELEATQFLPAKVVPAHSFTNRETVDFMTKYLKDNGCDLLIINTHAHKGLKKLFIGSFAETALLRADVSMLFISPNTQPTDQLNKILYPTDFSDKSFQLFKQMRENGTLVGQEVVLYSKIITSPYILSEPYHQGLVGRNISIEKVIQEITDLRRKDAESWVAYAKTQPLRCKIIVDETPGTAAEDFLATIKKTNVDLVVMPSFATRIDTILTGSLAREVVRSADVPVLVKHSLK